MKSQSNENQRRLLGAWAEALADQLFLERGYKPCENNARSAGIECDRLYFKPKSNLASHGSSDCFVFAEIKCRSSAAGGPIDRDALSRFLSGKQFLRQRNRFQRYCQRLKEKHPNALFFHVLVWTNQNQRKFANPSNPTRSRASSHGHGHEVRIFDLCNERMFQW